MSRGKRRMLLATALAAGLAICFVAAERIRGSRALARWERDMRSRGEKLGLDELTPPLPTNQAVSIVNPFEAQTLLGSAVFPDDWPAAMSMVAPGKARVASELSYWIDKAGKTNSWERMRSSIEALRSSLPELRASLTNRSFFIRLDYQAGFDLLLPHLARMKAAMLALNAGTVCALHERKLDEALENLVAACALLDVLGDEPLVISQLVNIADAAIIQTGVWEALQADGWSDAQLAVLQSGWKRQGFVLALTRALEMERAMQARYYEPGRYTLRQLVELTEDVPQLQVLGGPARGLARPPPGELQELFGPVIEKGRAARRLLHLLLWRLAWSRQDQLFHHRELQRVIELGRQAAAGRRWRAEGTTPAGETWRLADWPGTPAVLGSAYNRARYWMTLTTTSPSIANVMNKAVRLDVNCELVVAAIALKRHQLRHGRLPPTLEALCPEFLQTPPRDWYDGQPLRYRPGPGGGFVLYSIGEDCADDGGDSRDAEQELRSFASGKGKDIVWPQRATAEEVAAAESNPQAGRSKRYPAQIPTVPRRPPP